MSQLSNAAALDLIASVLDRQEWDADAVTRIADIVQRTGRTVRDLDDQTADEPKTPATHMVEVTRVSSYMVTADTDEDAVDLVLHGRAVEFAQETVRHTVERVRAIIGAKR